jgi:hypothetical protein
MKADEVHEKTAAAGEAKLCRPGGLWNGNTAAKFLQLTL